MNNSEKNSAGRLEADALRAMNLHGAFPENGQYSVSSVNRRVSYHRGLTTAHTEAINRIGGGDTEVIIELREWTPSGNVYKRVYSQHVTPASAVAVSDVPANQQPGKTPARAWQSQIHVRFTPTWYISDLPGQGGADWGWTDDPRKALALSEYWQIRFAAYARGNKRSWGFVPVASAVETSNATTQENKQ